MDYISTPDIKLLLEIQRTDFQRGLYMDEIASIPGKISRAEEDFRREEADRQTFSDALKKAQLRQREAELKAAETESLIEKYQLQIHSLKDNAAYQAMLNQIEGAKARKDEFETAALLLLEEIEKAAEEDSIAERRLEECRKKKTETLDSLEKRKNQLEAYASLEKQKKIQLSAKITLKEIFDKYETLRVKKKKIIFAVKDIAGGRLSCPCCNMSITSRTAGLLHKADTFAVCPECSAWLCLESMVL